MNRALFRRLLLPASIVAVIILAHTGAWWWLTNRMEAETEAWQAARRAEGYVVSAGVPARGGWPLRAEVSLPDVTLATGQPGAADALAWQVPALRLVFTPWQPTDITVEIDGTQSVRAGAAPPLVVNAEQSTILIPLTEAGQAAGAVMRAHGISLLLPGGAVEAGQLWLTLRPAEMQLSLSTLTLPIRNLPFGGSIASLYLHARSSVPLPPQRDLAAALAAWRAAGGQLSLDDVSLRWGPLDAGGNAQLGLDGAMQPAGSGTLHLTGYAEAIEALVRAGTITRNDARVIGTLLGLMSRSEAGKPPEVTLPVTLRDRTLATGAIPLLRLPALDLP
jgi:hypothetical protein